MIKRHKFVWSALGSRLPVSVLFSNMDQYWYFEQAVFLHYFSMNNQKEFNHTTYAGDGHWQLMIEQHPQHLPHNTNTYPHTHDSSEVITLYCVSSWFSCKALVTSHFYTLLTFTHFSGGREISAFCVTFRQGRRFMAHARLTTSSERLARTSVSAALVRPTHIQLVPLLPHHRKSFYIILIISIVFRIEMPCINIIRRHLILNSMFSIEFIFKKDYYRACGTWSARVFEEHMSSNNMMGVNVKQIPRLYYLILFNYWLITIKN